MQKNKNENRNYAWIENFLKKPPVNFQFGILMLNSFAEQSDSKNCCFLRYLSLDLIRKPLNVIMVNAILDFFIKYF